MTTARKLTQLNFVEYPTPIERVFTLKEPLKTKVSLYYALTFSAEKFYWSMPLNHPTLIERVFTLKEPLAHRLTRTQQR